MGESLDLTLLDGAGLAPSEAISFFRQKALLPSERFGEVMGEAHARAFAVAGAASGALLTDLKAAVNTALTSGTTLADFRKDFDRIVAKHGWQHGSDPGWRAKIIYNTNLATAYSAGQYAQLSTEEARDLFPAWRYRHHSCPHPRPEHVAWDGLVLANDDPWWDTHFPPNGWRCHCTVEPVTRSDLRRNNWTISEAPPLDMRPWRNPATGKTEMVPKGIDPSFDYNPGKAWLEGRKVAQTKQAPLTPRTHIGTTPVHHVPPVEREAQQAQDVTDLLKSGARGEVTAGTLPHEIQHVLGSSTPDIFLSDDTLSKNDPRHPEMFSDYVKLPELLQRPLIAQQLPKPLHVRLISGLRGKLYNLVIKRTRDGQRIYLQSFLRTRAEEVARMLRQTEPFYHQDFDLSDYDEN